jgi:hypothetical protein
MAFAAVPVVAAGWLVHDGTGRYPAALPAYDLDFSCAVLAASVVVLKWQLAAAVATVQWFDNARGCIWGC